MRMKLRILGIVLIVCLLAAGLITTHGHKQTTMVATPVGSYVALGDSVAAGYGLENYADASACDRTNQAYPELVARKLDLQLTSLACSGATLASGILGSQAVNNLAVTPQLTKLFELPKPKLISITIGANDVQWTSFITKCYSGDCGSTSDSQTVTKLLAGVTTNLTSVLGQIASHYPSATPPVVITGYYQVFPVAGGNCSDMTNISLPETTWVRLQQTNLNMTLQTVSANYSFVHFVGIDFTGHELCTPDSWLQGLTANAPYHPTDAGQAAIATQVELTATPLVARSSK